MTARTKRREPEAHVEVVWLEVSKTGRVVRCHETRAKARHCASLHGTKVIRAIATPTKRAGGGA